MAVKYCDRISHKEKVNKISRNPIREALPDEIALRDEILELKRQVVFLKKTNERSLVKFRKYEDEAKRKDRQIEQLMDPRKNAEITKVLSTKGAAILMNLKDQNNSLIQIILNKDLQIRRLTAEIKMSKLYAASRKSVPYRAEIVRLRNLLVKSRESLKENINWQQQQQERRSICVNENSLLETSSSSDQSSPRELEELRYTIQSLETHIKYSNDLLAKKNQEISLLTDELNTLRKIFQCKTNKQSSAKDFLNCKEQYFFDNQEALSLSPTYNLRVSEKFKPSKTSPDQEWPDLFEKSIKDRDKPPRSAPASFSSCSPFDDHRAKRAFQSPNEGETTLEIWSEEERNPDENITKKEVESEKEKNPNQITNKLVPTLRKSLLHDLAAGEVLREEKGLSARENAEKRDKIKEKWKSVLKKYQQFNKMNGENKDATEKIRREGETKFHAEKVKKTGDIVSDGSDLETHEFEMMEKEIQNEMQKTSNSEKIKYPTSTNELNVREQSRLDDDSFDGIAELEDTPESKRGEMLREHDSEDPTASRLVPTDDAQMPNEHVNGQVEPKIPNYDDEPKSESSTKSCQALETSSTLTNINVEESYLEVDSNDEMKKFKSDIQNMAPAFHPEVQRELRNLYENISAYEDMEMKKIKSLRQIYRQSLDSSFESENSYSIKQVQVEVEINSVPSLSDSSHSDSVPPKNRLSEFWQDDNANLAQDDDFNDDDDVITR